jgi:hypothetical protein
MIWIAIGAFIAGLSMDKDVRRFARLVIRNMRKRQA